MGRMHSGAQSTLFSSCSLGKINKFLLRSLMRRLTLFSSFSLGKISLLLLRSLVRQFAGSSSVKFLFLLSLGKTNKFLLRSLMRRFPHTPKMMGFLGIGQVMCKWANGSFTYTHNECSHYSPKATTPWLVLQKDKDAQRSWAIAVDISAALSK